MAGEMDLLEKIRASRESVVDAEGKKFTIRRPTEAEQITLFRQEGINSLDMVRLFVVGWNLQEIDLISGGSPVSVEFNAQVWAEYVNDKPALWVPLSDAITQSILSHREKVESAVKK